MTADREEAGRLRAPGGSDLASAVRMAVLIKKHLPCQNRSLVVRSAENVAIAAQASDRHRREVGRPRGGRSTGGEAREAVTRPRHRLQEASPCLDTRHRCQRPVAAGDAPQNEDMGRT